MFQNIFTYFSQLMPDYLQTCKVWGPAVPLASPSATNMSNIFPKRMVTLNSMAVTVPRH